MRTEKRPILALGRELLSQNDGKANQFDLSSSTGLPAWKISRLLKRLEILGFVEAREEPRLVVGRPRKLYKLTSSGAEYFTGLLEAGDEYRAENSPRSQEGTSEGWLR